MAELLILTKRNVKIFIRDKTAVFFSFLSVIILLSLYMLFLRNMYIDDSLSQHLNDKEIQFIINNMMMGGVLVVNTLTISLGNLGNIVNDFGNKKIDGFIVTPVSRFKLISAYFLSSLIITSVFTLLMWFASTIIIGITTSIWHSVTVFISVTFLLLLYTFISTAIMILVTTFIKSINAFGAVAGIFGTLIGFTCGIYIPLAILPKLIQNISALIPFTHMTIHLKSLLVAPFLKDLPHNYLLALNEAYGITPLNIFGLKVSITYILLFSILLSFSLLFFATKRLSRRISS